jgi:hypothetical protein
MKASLEDTLVGALMLLLRGRENAIDSTYSNDDIVSAFCQCINDVDIPKDYNATLTIRHQMYNPINIRKIKYK